MGALSIDPASAVLYLVSGGAVIMRTVLCFSGTLVHTVLYSTGILGM